MTRAVLRKELTALWASPLPYVIGAAFHAVLGVLAVNQLEVRGQAVLQPVVPLAGFLLLFVSPVLAMRTFSEELRTGSLDVLVAAGVPAWPLVVGKWLAVWLTGVALLIPLGALAVLVAMWGTPDWGPVITGAAGLTLLAAVLAGVGVLASSLTQAQPVAAAAAIFGVLVLWFAHVGSSVVTTGTVLASLSFSERLRTFAGGAIDTADVSFFVAATAETMVLAAMAVDLRRLR